MPQPVLHDDDDILPALLPPMDGALFPDDFLLLDELTPVAAFPAPEPRPVQVLAEPVLRLKILEEEAPRPQAIEKTEAPLDVTDWGPGPIGQFCCTVADWSDAIADGIDRWNAVLLRARQWGARQRDHVVALLRRR